jgi:L-threonylcarbamoyladenylate synthase
VVLVVVETRYTDRPEEAATCLRAGELVAFPTETVYGLGADAFNPAALGRIFQAKERPPDNPLIVHLAHPDQLGEVVSVVPGIALPLIEAFFPGPLTLVMPRHPRVPSVVSAGLPTVGVRMPLHPVAQAFLQACAIPVAAPSANRSGRPSPTTWQAVQADLDGRIACILTGPPAVVGLESTVVDCTGAAPLVLRPGAVTLEALQAVWPATRLATTDDALRRSPGTRHRHYAPQAQVCLVDAPSAAPPDARHAWIGLDMPAEPGFGLVQPCTDVTHYAQVLFDFFRRCDAAGIAMVFCQRVPPTGLGRALMDRLTRATQR